MRDLQDTAPCFNGHSCLSRCYTFSFTFTAATNPTKTTTSNKTWLTRTSAFQKLCEWAFSVCDSNGTGSINKTELYAGFLLVHLNLAKYAGPAACYPPPRATVDKLFEASDDDHSGGIDEKEFTSIMMILFSQITSRIAVYYAILILLVPYICTWILVTLDVIGVDDTLLKMDSVFDYYAPWPLQWMLHWIPASMWEDLPNRIVSLVLFFLAIPFLFNWIDEKSRSIAEQTVVYRDNESATTSTTTASVTSPGEKKED